MAHDLREVTYRRPFWLTGSYHPRSEPATAASAPAVLDKGRLGAYLTAPCLVDASFTHDVLVAYAGSFDFRGLSLVELAMSSAVI